MSTVTRAFELEEPLAQQLCNISKSIGKTPSETLHMIVRDFLTHKGLDVISKLSSNLNSAKSEGNANKRIFNYNHPLIIEPKIRNGHLVFPISWRDDDDDNDDIYDDEE